MPAHPSLNLLRTFEVAGRHLSFRRAAEELHVTASAISHQMRDLEEQLGLPLFVRGHRALSLTPEGERYHGAVTQGLALIDAATRALQHEGPAHLRVSAMPFIATDILAPALGTFLADWPGVRVDVLAEARSVDVAAGETDVAIRYGLAMRDTAIPLLPVACTLVCAPELAVVLREDPARLESTPLYMLSGYADLWEQWLHAQGWKPANRRNVMSLNTYRGLLTSASRNGVTLGLVPLVVELLEQGSLAAPWPQRLMPMGHVSLEVREAVRRRPEVVALVSRLRELFAGHVSRWDELFSAPGAE